MATPRQLLTEAVALHRDGRTEEAAALYRRVLTIVPEHADALHLLGVTAAQAGRPAEAERLIRRAIARRPGEADFHADLGTVLLNLDRPIAAAEAFTRALRLAPERAGALGLRLARALVGCGRYREALPVLRETVAIGVTGPRERYWYASLAAQYADPAIAEAAFRALAADTLTGPDSALGRVARMVHLDPAFFQSLETAAAVLGPPAPAAPLATPPPSPPCDGSPDESQRLTLLFGCDSRYFHLFCAPVLESVHAHAGMPVHIHMHVVDPDPAVAPAFAALTRRFGLEGRLSTSAGPGASGPTDTDRNTADRNAVDLGTDVQTPAGATPEPSTAAGHAMPAHTTGRTGTSAGPAAAAAATDEFRRTWYACARFLQLPALLADARGPVLVLDMDQQLQSPLAPLLAAVSAYDAAVVRVAANRVDFSSHLLANVVYAAPTPSARRLFGLVAAYLHRILTQTPQEAGWFLDQVALHAAWLHTCACDPDFRGGDLPPDTVNPGISPASATGTVFRNLYYSVPTDDRGGRP